LISLILIIFSYSTILHGRRHWDPIRRFLTYMFDWCVDAYEVYSLAELFDILPQLPAKKS